ncbi:MAG TPA: pyruvate kinase [Oceanithermus profundus]|uniref:Pyruvate kinase n=1 Tax=Oceanithermus profundus TaxID=187137 RepID=A0A7C4Z6H1_9DEIN|nr:pyruvate kinase [Oceanithermus profundus]
MLSKRTKIVATLGPASRAPEVLARMIAAGLDVVRLNFSHGRPDDHRSTVQAVRDAAERAERPVAILQDLQGPKIRVGRFAEGQVVLEPGQPFVLTTADVSGDAHKVSVSYKGLVGDVEPGQQLLLDDGRLRLRVERVDHAAGEIHTVVELGGALSDHKGINIPGADLSIPAVTDKDIEDLALGAELGVDWVAVSFVRSRDDLLLARHYMNRLGHEAKLMAKIEKPGAVQRFDEILAEADGVMVARGDLGVEMPPEEVPIVQKRLIRRTRAAGKPVITATQMLESMIHAPNPTRAEASDVANAIFDGSDAVMLSAETAVGEYPVEAVAMMARVARAVEGSPEYQNAQRIQRPEPEHNTQDAIALAATEVAESLPAKVVVVFTASGSSLWRVARYRPGVPVLALTPNARVRRQLVLASGVYTALAPDPTSTDEMVAEAVDYVKRAGLAEAGDRIVITAGVPFGVRGSTNMVWVEQVK